MTERALDLQAMRVLRHAGAGGMAEVDVVVHDGDV